MQDPERQHPARRSQRNNGRQYPAGDEPPELDPPAPINHNSQDWPDQDEPSDASTLPSSGLQYTLIGGVAAGILSALISIAITLLNAAAFQTAAAKGTNVAYSTALSVVGLQCLEFFVSLLICFGAGYIVGKVAVQRRLGFYTGALAGAIIYLGEFLMRYVPNYPGNLARNTPGSAEAFAGGLLISLVFLLIWAIIAGLISLWGAWAATRRHPYYLSQPKEDDES
jgi:hypothetical protein